MVAGSEEQEQRRTRIKHEEAVLLVELQPLAERDRKCTTPYGSIPSETNREQETVPKGREEGGHHAEDDHRCHRKVKVKNTAALELEETRFLR